jgi:hypothetical protein
MAIATVGLASIELPTSLDEMFFFHTGFAKAARSIIEIVRT